MLAVVIYWSLYFESNGMINNTIVNNLLNDTLYDTYKLCCETNNTEISIDIGNNTKMIASAIVDTNTNTNTNTFNNVCYDILGHNTTKLEIECSSFSKFSSDLYSYIQNIYIYLLIFGCLTVVFTLFSGISSCKLIWLYNRVYYYRSADVSL